MKVLNLDINDSEVFNYDPNEDIYQFFSNERENFKKMFEDQGKTFWLRLLFTYQHNVECDALSKVNYESLLEIMKDRVVDFLLIYIHKNFIEAKCPEFAEKFIQGLIDKHRLFKNCNMSNSPMLLHITKLFKIFISNSKNPDVHDDCSLPLIHIICKLSFGFANAICTLLKRWLKESDLTKDAASGIDYTLYYWRPFNYESGNFTPGCFEKYISTYWNKKLPKMLLIGKIDEIFSNHKISDCCEAYTMDREPCKEPNKVIKIKSLNRIDVYSPDIAMCSDHNNCCVKIRHSKDCLEPYMCKGNKSCVMTCETSCAEIKKKKTKEFLKNCSIQIFQNKGGKTRTVATQVESDSQLETYYPVGPKLCNVTEGLEELLFSPHPVLKNSYIQMRRKEDYRLKLKKKLIKKYEIDYEDPSQMRTLYDDAIFTFLKESACAEDLKNKISCSAHTVESNLNLLKSLEHTVNLKFKFISVAVGTSGIIFGQIVLPSIKCSKCPAQGKSAGKLPDKPKSSKQINALPSNTNDVEKVNEIRGNNNKAEKANIVENNGESKFNDLWEKTLNKKIKENLKNNIDKKEIDENNLGKNEHIQTNKNKKDIENNTDEIECFENILDKKENAYNKVENENAAENNKVETIEIDENAKDKSDNDEDLKTFYNFVNTSDNKGNAMPKKHKLKSCAFCQKKEIEYKTFKRCSRCKVENLPNQYYYCSRECQVSDWEKSHREIHLKKN